MRNGLDGFLYRLCSLTWVHVCHRWQSELLQEGFGDFPSDAEDSGAGGMMISDDLIADISKQISEVMHEAPPPEASAALSYISEEQRKNVVPDFYKRIFLPTNPSFSILLLEIFFRMRLPCA